jgi:AraC-like DNA-binding protein
VNGVQKVWQFAAEHTDDYFGIRVAECLTPASLHALGFALWCSSNLRDYFERYIRYRCVLSHSHFCELIEEEKHFRLSLVDERNIKSEVTQDAATGFFLGMARQLLGNDFAPAGVHITRIVGAGSDQLRRFYGPTLETGCDAYAVLLRKEDLDRPMRFANPVLAAQQDAIVEQYIAEQGLISEYMLRVRTHISQLLDAGEISIEAVASCLNVTVRTLQRRLSDENSSYNQLLDDVRKQVAMGCARDPSASATETAFKLGFIDSGSFGRSFKRWTGKSFTDYRHDLAKKEKNT